MATVIKGVDLEGLRIISLQLIGMTHVSARCPLCQKLVSLELTIQDVESNRAVSKDCRSGDWPNTFQLSARYSPSETDHSSGVDVWGEVFEHPED